ncbi:hypothetical protein, partial [Candidatus Vampirococcus lugosii]|uniref:hypothetical protein n=1 Tax=Candidatus Vampirococcus lugosii TaxID=2789015 RepID=UPI001BD02FA1
MFLLILKIKSTKKIIIPARARKRCGFCERKKYNERDLVILKNKEMKKILIGTQDFKTFINEKGYYIDKTKTIHNLLISN